jgi:tetratricopeptide (TPR) repeat protein
LAIATIEPEANLRHGGRIVQDTRPTPGPASAECTRGETFGGGAHEDREIAIGTRLHRYVLLDRLGHGGMGVVYLADDPAFDRRVALKVLRSDARDQEQLIREAQAMARLSHPNVVQIYDVGRHDGRVFLAMELVRGEQLAAWLRGRGRGFSEVIAAFVQAGRGLAAAHAVGIVHRDFKPANVFVEADESGARVFGRVLVGDFGVARSDRVATPGGDSTPGDPTSREPESSRGENVLVGTPRYMAPEQHVGARALATADQFAFCVSLYEALWGRPPHADTTYWELVTAKLRGQVRPPPTRSNVPKRVRAAIFRGLSPRAEDRWPDMDALLAELVAGSNPRAHRRAIVFGVLATVGLVAMLVDPNVADECSTRALEWDDDARAAVQARFAATGLPYAAAADGVVDRQLTAFASEWRAEHEAACRSPQPEAGPRMRCLEQSRASMRALVDALREADAAVIERAASAVSRLPSPSTCAAARAGPAEPSAAITDEIDRHRDALAAAEALAGLGRFADAKAAADTVLADADALGYAPLVAESRLAVGTYALRSGDARTGAAMLAEALWTASACGHDRIVAGAAIELVGVAAEGHESHGDAATWARHAEVALDRMPDAPLERARLADALAFVHEQRGEYDEAATHVRSALALLEAIEPAPELALADVHGRLGEVMFLSGDYPAATLAHERARALRERLLGPDHPDVANALNGLGIIAQSRGDVATAIELHEHALSIHERALGPEHPLVAGTLTNLASAHLENGEIERARALYDRSLAIKERVLGRDHPQLKNVLSNSGVVAVQQHDYPAARRLFARAAAIVEAEYGAEHPELAAILNNVGVVQSREGDNAGAVATYERVLAIEQRTLGGDHPQLASTHYNLAVSLLRLSRWDDAHRHHRRALELFERSEGPEGASTALARIGVGDALLGRGDATAAAAMFEQVAAAVDESSATHALADFGLARVLATHGETVRARELATAARDRLAALDRTSERDRVDAWLAQ